MGATRVNHVSVNAKDLEASVRFYTELFGAELLATPNFGMPVQWLGLGDTQLHLFERDQEPLSNHHFAVEVDELEPVYRKAEQLDAFDSRGFGHHLFELPGDCAQLYLRDPAGNLVEIDTPGASRLPDELRGVMKPLADVHPQTDENLRARLYVGGAS